MDSFNCIIFSYFVWITTLSLYYDFVSLNFKEVWPDLKTYKQRRLKNDCWYPKGD